MSAFHIKVVEVCMYVFAKYVCPKSLGKTINLLVNKSYPIVPLQDSTHLCIRQLITHFGTNTKTIYCVNTHNCVKQLNVHF